MYKMQSPNEDMRLLWKAIYKNHNEIRIITIYELLMQ